MATTVIDGEFTVHGKTETVKKDGVFKRVWKHIVHACTEIKDTVKLVAVAMWKGLGAYVYPKLTVSVMLGVFSGLLVLITEIAAVAILAAVIYTVFWFFYISLFFGLYYAITELFDGKRK